MSGNLHNMGEDRKDWRTARPYLLKHDNAMVKERRMAFIESTLHFLHASPKAMRDRTSLNAATLMKIYPTNTADCRCPSITPHTLYPYAKESGPKNVKKRGTKTRVS